LLFFAAFQVYEKIGSLNQIEGFREQQALWLALSEDYQQRIQGSRELATSVLAFVTTMKNSLAQQYQEDGYLEHFIEVKDLIHHLPKAERSRANVVFALRLAYSSTGKPPDAVE
jgi:formyltetrahydrofolate synthetase